MKILDQLDKLNLDAAAKTQVGTGSSVDQVKRRLKYETDYSSQRPEIRPSFWNWPICGGLWR
jgi:hypothetical protein